MNTPSKPPKPPQGLTSDEARVRLRDAGPNEPAAVHRTTAFSELARSFTNPLIAVLLVASVVSATLGEWINATIIVAMVVLSIAINFIQTYHSHRVVEELRKSVAPTAIYIGPISSIYDFLTYAMLYVFRPTKPGSIRAGLWNRSRPRHSCCL